MSALRAETDALNTNGLATVASSNHTHTSGGDHEIMHMCNDFRGFARKYRLGGAKVKRYDVSAAAWNRHDPAECLS